jgi:hypothetical protein
VPPLYELLSGKTNVMGYHDGYPAIFDWVRTNNVWRAGAYADLLTSYGGCIEKLTNVTTQSTVLDWMGIGATAAFGTVNEPCAYLEKFPDPLMGFFYARGFTVGEAYAMAVAAPYQGLFAGDPLAAPFAAPPTLTVTSPAPYQIVTGNVSVLVSAAARSNGAPAARLDFYLDERFRTNLAAVAPTRFNRLSVVVGSRTNSATVGMGDDLFDAVAAWPTPSTPTRVPSFPPAPTAIASSSSTTTSTTPATSCPFPHPSRRARRPSSPSASASPPPTSCRPSIPPARRSISAPTPTARRPPSPTPATRSR